MLRESGRQGSRPELLSTYCHCLLPVETHVDSAYTQRSNDAFANLRNCTTGWAG